jgi:hypothetical protein
MLATASNGVSSTLSCCSGIGSGWASFGVFFFVILSLVYQ